MSAKVVILAAGLGKRMRRDDAGASLTASQAATANAGIKAMISFGRPFLDYSLSAIADAGYRRVCLVIGPGHQQIRDYYVALHCARLEIEFVVQLQQLGTAHALLAAADFAGQDELLVLNGDNYYPAEALCKLREADGNALIGFERNSLITESNIPTERIAAFSIIEEDAGGYLTNIVEKPAAGYIEELQAGAAGRPLRVSMNCWHFRPSIFVACRAIGMSPRGEFELPDAVTYAIRELGERYRVLPCSSGVLDLSQRSDIAAIQRRLENVQVRL